jgi:hypothetical protein
VQVGREEAVDKGEGRVSATNDEGEWRNNACAPYCGCEKVA